YNLQSAQISVLWGYKIIRENLSIEAGPALNINGKLALKDTQYENYIVDGYTTLRAIDLENVSTVNFHIAGGLTSGFRNFRVFGQYQYCVTDMLNKLNKEGLEKYNFMCNSSLLSVGITFYFYPKVFTAFFYLLMGSSLPTISIIAKTSGPFISPTNE